MLSVVVKRFNYLGSECMTTPPIIRKAVFPVAGLGVRFLPATKANPKEMLPVVDKPLIQYAVEEAVAAGVTQLIFVTNSSKRAIEDHFDDDEALEKHLHDRGYDRLLELVQNIRPQGVSCVYVRQAAPKGLGNAVLCARDVVGDEPFAVILADDLIAKAPNNPKNCLQQMIEVYQQQGGNIVAVERVEPEQTHKYGIIAARHEERNISQVLEIVEKPTPERAPSNLAVAGRYILNPSIFDALETILPGAGGEIQLTDAIAQLLSHQSVRALEFLGKRYDCGSKLGYLQASVVFALQHPDIGPAFADYIAQLQQSNEGAHVDKHIVG